MTVGPRCFALSTALAYMVMAAVGLAAQTAAPAVKDAPATPAVQVVPRDPVLDIASNQIGRALFLRCFCAEDNLAFDAQGHLETPKPDHLKTTDWTLSAVNVLKAERKGPGELELEGVRVAVRYATDRHEFDRHPLKDETVKILIADPGDAQAFDRTLAAIFATGIDRPLQRSMPDFWQHYFEPQKPWEKDALTGETIASPADTPKPEAEQTDAIVKHKTEPGYTDAALHDHVQGTVAARAVVDTDGRVQRMAVVQPLGYGLDAKVVDALKRFQFSPATVLGQPVAMNVLLRQEFVLVTPPR